METRGAVRIVCDRINELAPTMGYAAAARQTEREMPRRFLAALEIIGSWPSSELDVRAVQGVL